MKIGEFFEKHVQSIALGLAALWLLYVGWTYGINRPVVEISGETFSPGAVDEHIRETEADKLARKIADPSMPTGLADVPDFTDAFVASMNAQPPKPLPFAYVYSPPPIDQIRDEYEPGRRRINEKVKEVPTIVVATDLTPLAGRTLVLQPPPAPKLAPNPNNNNEQVNNQVAARPNIFNEEAPQPAAPPVNQNGNVQPVGNEAQLDKTWVTIFAKLNIDAQKREFERVKIPQALQHLMFVEVQMQRQEVEPDGKLGPIELVKGLPMNEPPVDRKMPRDFINWAANAESQKMILIPEFYKWVRGTAWEIPQKDIAVADANANNPPPVEQFDPSAKYQEWKNAKNQLERNKITESMTPEQRRIFTQYRLAEEEKERKSRAPQPPPRGTRPGGGTGPGGTGTGGGRQPPRGGRGGENLDGFDAIDPALLREMYADVDPSAQQNRRFQRRPRDMDFDSAGPPGRRQFNEEEGFIDGQQHVQPRQGNVLGNITPDKQGNIDVWAHDETAQPGRTYRYRLRVVIANPLYDTNIHADEKINKEPYLPLDPNASWSEWTKPVAIPTNVDMMLVNAQVLGGREIARFKIKRFQKGQINDSKLFEVAPGDVIGGLEKAQGATEPIDFTTNWTVVDIRPAGSDFKVRIMDAQGRMETRTVHGDRNRFKEEPAAKPGVAGAVGFVRPRE